MTSLNIKQNVICKVNVLGICLCEEIRGYPPPPSFPFFCSPMEGIRLYRCSHQGGELKVKMPRDEGGNEY